MLSKKVAGRCKCTYANDSTSRIRSKKRRHAVIMDLPKTTSPEMKTAKKMNNVQSQTKIKLHQLIRKILARYLYSSQDPLQRKKHPCSRSRQTKTKTYSFKLWRNKIRKNCLLKSRSTKTLRLCKNREENQSVT